MHEPRDVIATIIGEYTGDEVDDVADDIIEGLQAEGFVIERAPELPRLPCRWDPTNMRPYGERQCLAPATRHFYVMGRRVDACEECARLAGAK